MIVMKFGGTSVGIPANFSAALAIVAERAHRDDGDPPIVVVSALHGVTNLLVEWCREPSHRAARAGAIDLRHRDFVRDAGLELRAVQPLLGEWGSVSA